MVFDTDQLSTYRLFRSMIAIRYSNPYSIRPRSWFPDPVVVLEYSHAPFTMLLGGSFFYRDIGFLVSDLAPKSFFSQLIVPSS